MTANDIDEAASAAREASRRLAILDTAAKNRLLFDLAERLAAVEAEILAANASDMAAAHAAGLAAPRLRRLELSPASLSQVRDGLRQVAALPDPVGEVTLERTVPSGLKVRKVRSPLGVVAMVFESRPAVTIDAFALCFKSGNSCILKGGREAARACRVLADTARDALRDHGLPEAAMTTLTELSHEGLRHLLTLDQWIDLVIPRGGTDLIRFVREHSRIPTVQHYQGVCHIFVDASADPEMAERVCVTAKTSAPATCNAAECILVHERLAETFLPRLLGAYREAGVEVRLNSQADYGREFLDLVVAVRVVGGLDDALGHIARYASNHTEAILTRDVANADRFCREVQSSCVLVNASTRFNDGFQLGLGAEIGISTSRIHAYGPMGLEELTTQRWVVRGDGQTR